MNIECWSVTQTMFVGIKTNPKYFFNCEGKGLDVISEVS